MTTKWTPGPWTVHESSHGDGCSAIRAEGRGDFIAQIRPDREERMSEAEADANAHLIAAAPLLVRALADVASLLALHAGGMRDATVEAALASAHAALAAAEGK